MTNHIKTSLRALNRNRSYTLINIGGLAIGLISCIVIFLIVRTETSFDNFHSKADRTYRLVADIMKSGELEQSPASYSPTAKALRNDFPEIENTVATHYTGNGMLSWKNPESEDIKRIYEDEGIAFAESHLFEIFDFNIVKGATTNILDNKNSIALSESTAQKFFSEKDPIGKTISLDNTLDLEIVAIFQDPPANTSLPFTTAIISFESLSDYASLGSDLNDWRTRLTGIQTFVLLPQNYEPEILNAQLGAFRDKYIELDENGEYKLHLQPLTSIHTDSRYGDYEGDAVSMESIYALMIIGFFIVLTACINFVNLSSAQAIKRAKSTGIRKVIGSGKARLIFSFLTETAIIVTIALIISIVLIDPVLSMIQKSIGFGAPIVFELDTEMILFIIAIFLFTVLISGIYPAFVISSYKPLQTLKLNLNTNRKGISMRKGLIVLQFVISQMLIVGVVIVFQQIAYFNSKDLGFSGDSIITIPLPENDEHKLELLKNELNSSPLVVSSTFSMTPPLSDGDLSTSYSVPAAGIEDEEIVLKFADADFIRTYDLTLLAGRELRRNDSLNNVLVNEALLRKMKVDNPADALGMKISMGRDRTIVGVVKNFNSLTLHSQISPILIGILPSYYFSGGVKLTSTNLDDALPFVENAWNKVFPEYVYDYEFFDQAMARYYEQEHRLSSLLIIFSILSIFISCIGLLGVVTYMAEQKTKEIGIRKVLGATISSIIHLFSKEFIILLGIAFVIASPLGWFVMEKWLADFAYRININPTIFLGVGIVTLIITIATVGYKSFGAATTNPAKILKDE